MTVKLAVPERIALFKVLVDQAAAITAARRDTSRFFLTFNTAVVGGFGYLLANDSTLPPIFLIVISVAMAIVSFLWFSLLRHYGRINRAKFLVIFEVEKEFEVQPFRLEEKLMWPSEPTGNGAERKPRVGLGVSAIESIIPLLFMLGYLIFAYHMYTVLQQPPAPPT